jgi:N utilization substance protein A
MSLDCVVEDDQLSLAIGKKGQNVRLASALIGMKIEIKGETEVKGEVAEALTRMLMASRLKQVTVGDVPGITPKAAERLASAGIGSLSELLEKGVAELSEIPGIGAATAEKILEAARAAEDEVRNPRPADEEVGAEEESEAAAEDTVEASGEEAGGESQPAEETIVQE